MKTIKRTYDLPTEALEVFERQVSPPQRSAVVADLLRAWAERQETEQRHRDIIAGCQEMAALYQEIEREYHPLEEEVQRALDA